jgi:hypothetical protein
VPFELRHFYGRFFDGDGQRRCQTAAMTLSRLCRRVALRPVCPSAGAVSVAIALTSHRVDQALHIGLQRCAAVARSELIDGETGEAIRHHDAVARPDDAGAQIASVACKSVKTNCVSVMSKMKLQ